MLRPTARSRRTIVRQWRWGAVALGILALCLLPSLVAAWPVDEPDIAPETLMERIDGSSAEQFHGLFESRGGVRVPDLGRYEDQVRMFTETSRVRVWYAAPDRWRADELTIGGETGWYREPAGLWRWRTGRQQVVFATREDSEPARFPRPMDLSPTELGRRMVHEALVSPGSMTVETISARRVAGHVGAGIRLTPTDPSRTTITSIAIWADADSGVVLRAEIFTGGSVPIFETGYLDLSFSAPSADVLSFDPDETGVVYRTSTTMDAIETLAAVGLPLPDDLAGLPRRSGQTSGVQTYGTGASIVSAFAIPRGVLPRGLRNLPSTERPWGGRAIVVEAGLVNVQIVDGAGFSYLLAGTVPVTVLDEIAAALVGADS